jgi:dUTP pyrophosphatase
MEQVTDEASKNYVGDGGPGAAPASLKLLIKKLHKDAKLPTRAYAGDAGLDLYSVESKSLGRGSSGEFHTGIAVEIPYGYFGLMGTRSSFGKDGLFIHPGVIDAGYRGELTVFIRNHGRDFDVLKGYKIAQLLILPVPNIELVETTTLNPSSRGERALGSSGR